MKLEKLKVLFQKWFKLMNGLRSRPEGGKNVSTVLPACMEVEEVSKHCYIEGNKRGFPMGWGRLPWMPWEYPRDSSVMLSANKFPLSWWYSCKHCVKYCQASSMTQILSLEHSMWKRKVFSLGSFKQIIEQRMNQNPVLAGFLLSLMPEEWKERWELLLSLKFFHVLWMVSSLLSIKIRKDNPHR